MSNRSRSLGGNLKLPIPRGERNKARLSISSTKPNLSRLLLLMLSTRAHFGGNESSENNRASICGQAKKRGQEHGREEGATSCDLGLPRLISSAALSLPRAAEHLPVPANFPDSARCALCVCVCVCVRERGRERARCTEKMRGRVEVPIYSDTALLGTA